MPDALFIRDGDVFQPTELTQGPWSPDAQHGGPPAALLARAIEHAESSTQMIVGRLSVELLRPVPLAPLRLVTEVIRPGRKVQLVEATLIDSEVPVARALGLRIRLENQELPFPTEDGPPTTPPERARPARFFESPGAFATEGMEVRVVEGDFAEAGPGKAWLRLRVPLVAGEETTPVQTACAAADFGNGISNLDPDRRWLFINPDLVVRFARPPEGEWTFLDARTALHPTGTGLAESVLHDRLGRFGSGSQSLLVEPLADR